MPWFSGVIYDAVPENCEKGVKGGSTIKLKKRQYQYRKEYKWFGNGTLVPVRTVEGEYADKDQFFSHLRVVEFFHIHKSGYFEHGRNIANPLLSFNGGQNDTTGMRKPWAGRKVVQKSGQVFVFKCGHSATIPPEGTSSSEVLWSANKNTKRGGAFACRSCSHESRKKSTSEKLEQLLIQLNKEVTELNTWVANAFDVPNVHELCCFASEQSSVKGHSEFWFLKDLLETEEQPKIGHTVLKVQRQIDAVKTCCDLLYRAQLISEAVPRPFTRTKNTDMNERNRWHILLKYLVRGAAEAVGHLSIEECKTIFREDIWNPNYQQSAA